MTVLSSNDAIQLYHENYVQYQGRLYWAIAQGGGTSNLELHDVLESRNPAIVVEANPDTVLSPHNFQLGYLNDGTQDAWYSRAPRRNYGVGWNANNSGVPSLQRWRRGAKILAQQFAGVYPNVRDALERSSRSGNRFAISRDFAVEDRNAGRPDPDRTEKGILSYRGTGICRINGAFECYDYPAGTYQHLVNLYNEVKGV